MFLSVTLEKPKIMQILAHFLSIPQITQASSQRSENWARALSSLTHTFRLQSCHIELKAATRANEIEL